MSVLTWDGFHASPSTARQRQRRRTSQAVRPILPPHPVAPAALRSAASALRREPATRREHAAIIALAIAVAALHTAVASQWESAPAPPAPAPQVTVELVKPKEIEPPTPPKPPEPPKAPKPLPQKLQAPPRAAPRAAPQPQPTPPLQATEAAANTAPLVTVPPAPPVQAPVPEVVTPASASAAYLHNPPPAYPPSAQRLGLEGKVVLRVRVLASGKAANVELHTSSGRKMLDEAAVAAVQGWTFAPARRGQTPIDGWATVPVEFKLERS